MIILNKFNTEQLSDADIPDYITRDSELVTTSGILYNQMGDIDIDGGVFMLE